jgi:hypothetical protein
MPANDIEQLVCSELGKLLGAPLDLLAQCRIDVVPLQLAKVFETCGTLAIRAEKRDRALIRAVVQQVTVHPDAVAIALATARLTELLALPRPADPLTLVHRVAVRLTRTGRALRLVDDSGSAAAEDRPHETLARLVARARTWWATLEQTGRTVTDLSVAEGVTASYLTRVLRLAFLSPEIVSAVVSGSLRAGVDASQLFCAGAISSDWAEQHRALLPRTERDSATSSFNSCGSTRQLG